MYEPAINLISYINIGKNGDLTAFSSAEEALSWAKYLDEVTALCVRIVDEKFLQDIIDSVYISVEKYEPPKINLVYFANMSNNNRFYIAKTRDSCLEQSFLSDIHRAVPVRIVDDSFYNMIIANALPQV